MTELLAPGQEPLLRSLARPGTLVVLDFDGTLAPIVGDRHAARLSSHSRKVLARLARLHPVAVLSGRAVQDVRDRLGGVTVRWVVGSHGAEWPGALGRRSAWPHLVARWRTTLERRLAGLAGVEFEVKPASLAVHYRRCADAAMARRSITAAAATFPDAVVIGGKRVVNLVPRGAGDKGTALRRLVRAARAERVLFVGDDVTDEAAFASRPGVPAVMVRVGRATGTRAGYWLRRRADVDVILERLCELTEAAGAGDLMPHVGGGPDLGVEALGPVLGFMKELWALQQGLNKRSRAMLGTIGMTGPQRLALLVLGRLGPTSPGRLARLLHLHPSSVTRSIRGLERRGLVRRTIPPAHRGRVLLELTPRAARLERPDTPTVEGAIEAALGSATARDVAASLRVIALVAERLETGGAAAPLRGRGRGPGGGPGGAREVATRGSAPRARSPRRRPRRR